MATKRLMTSRMQEYSVPNFENIGDPMLLQQDMVENKPPSFLSKMFKWLLFGIIPMAVVAILLVFSRLSIILDSNGDIDMMKVFLFSSIAGIAGIVVKFFVFR